MRKTNSIKFSIILTDIFLIVLFLVAISLPMLVTWYVKYTGRNENLATTLMVTCYPCAPFTGLTLFYLRKVLKNIKNGNYTSKENIKLLKYMCLCCVIIATITLIAGRFFLPFYLVAGTFLFITLLIFVFRNIFINVFMEKECK